MANTKTSAKNSELRQGCLALAVGVLILATIAFIESDATYAKWNKILVRNAEITEAQNSTDLATAKEETYSGQKLMEQILMYLAFCKFPSFFF